jgi:hypothetical protein
MSDENQAIAEADDDYNYGKTKTAPPKVDIEKLLAEADLDSVLTQVHVTVVDPGPQANALLALCAEDRKLAAETKALASRREVIRDLIKQAIKPGDDNLIVMEGDGEEQHPRVLAKMSYPEPTTRVNTAYIKENFPAIDYPEMWTRTESTPRLLVQP